MIPVTVATVGIFICSHVEAAPTRSGIPLHVDKNFHKHARVDARGSGGEMGISLAREGVRVDDPDARQTPSTAEYRTATRPKMSFSV